MMICLKFCFDIGISQAVKALEDEHFLYQCLRVTRVNRKYSRVSCRIDIIKPATLVLYNLNQSYDGTYQFELSLFNPFQAFISEVRVFIARKLTSKYFENGFHRPFLGSINLYMFSVTRT